MMEILEWTGAALVCLAVVALPAWAVISGRRLHRLAEALAWAVNGTVYAAASKAKKVVVLVTGGAVLLVGVAMIVLPGPAVLVIPMGLAILATEFLWARRLLARVRSEMSGAARRLFKGGGKQG